jgi:hypothetical protein
LLGASDFWGEQTGPNPTDRGKNGSKRHVACDGRGTSLAIMHAGENVHDSQAAIPLINAIPSIKRPGGGRRKRPDAAFADRAYDAERRIRVPLRKRGISPFIARRNTEHGSGIGCSVGCSNFAVCGFATRNVTISTPPFSPSVACPSAGTG